MNPTLPPNGYFVWHALDHGVVVVGHHRFVAVAAVHTRWLNHTRGSGTDYWFLRVGDVPL